MLWILFYLFVFIVLLCVFAYLAWLVQLCGATLFSLMEKHN